MMESANGENGKLRNTAFRHTREGGVQGGGKGKNGVVGVSGGSNIKTLLE